MKIAIDYDRIADFCRRHHIQRLALFGSVLRGDFQADSDVDVLVEFDAGATVGLIRLAGMEFELSEILGRKPTSAPPATSAGISETRSSSRRRRCFLSWPTTLG